MRKETVSPSEINFSIVKVIDNLNRHNNIYSEISDELTDFKNDNVQRTVQLATESDFVRETTTSRTNRRRREHTRHGQVSKKPRLLS